MTNLIDIIVPTMRPNMAKGFMENTDHFVFAVVHEDNYKLKEEWLRAGAIVLETDKTTFAEKCNRAYKVTNGKYLLFVGEDVKFQRGWSYPLDKYEGYGVIGTNDLLYSNEHRAAHLIMTRQYIRESGGSW